jgi:hypothetical protein
MRRRNHREQHREHHGEDEVSNHVCRDNRAEHPWVRSGNLLKPRSNDETVKRCVHRRSDNPNGDRGSDKSTRIPYRASSQLNQDFRFGPNFHFGPQAGGIVPPGIRQSEP